MACCAQKNNFLLAYSSCSLIIASNSCKQRTAAVKLWNSPKHKLVTSLKMSCRIKRKHSVLTLKFILQIKTFFNKEITVESLESPAITPTFSKHLPISKSSGPFPSCLHFFGSGRASSTNFRSASLKK